MITNQTKERYATTNDQGRFELDQFVEEDQLSFQMMGYEKTTLNRKEIGLQDHVVALF